MTNDLTPPIEHSQIVRDFAGQLIQDSSKVYSNLGQEIILTTEDKMRLCLIEHLSRTERRNAWITPLGVLLTIVVVFPTTTFRDFMLIEAETWKAMFMIAGILCAIWLIKSLLNARVSTSVDDVVADIKQTGYGREELERIASG